MWVRLVTGMMLLVALGCRKESQLERSLAARTGEVALPGGESELSRPLVIDGANNLTLRGDGRNRLAMNFEGKAAVIIRNSKNVKLENFTLQGNRELQDKRHGLPPAGKSMATWNEDNGILIESSEGVILDRLTIRNVAGYAVLVSRSRTVTVQEVLVGDSGSLDKDGQNNATGGILFEEGCEDFAVRNSKLRNIRGNGIWTHSLYRSPRNRGGFFEGNDVRYVGRDALQAGHAVKMVISGNTGSFIGFPSEIVDVSAGAVPVGVDTAGNVEQSVYRGNRFEEVNGKCIDLDGFHDGEVVENECLNRREAGAYPHGHYGIVLNNSNPDMESRNIRIEKNRMEGFRFGGIFLIGEGHIVRYNTLLKLNLAHCNENPAIGCLYKAGEPDLLRSGIYLARAAHRPSPSRGIVIDFNTVQGFGMTKYCVVTAPGVSAAGNKLGYTKCGE